MKQALLIGFLCLLLVLPALGEETPMDLTRSELAQLEWILCCLGYDPGRMDGTLDEGSRTAIGRFRGKWVLSRQDNSQRTR